MSSRTYKLQDPSILGFIMDLNKMLETETFNNCYYDFGPEKMKEKNKMYTIIETIKNDNNYMKHFCDEINSELSEYSITNITNIICGKTYKHKNRIDMPIQISDGYYYRFTVICKKKSISP